MNPTDETAAKIEAPESTSAPADFAHNEHATVTDFDRANGQQRPVEDLRNLLLRISHHLDYETSERSTIYYRLLAIDAQAKKIESQTKSRALRTLVRYLVAMCIGIAGTLAWQSYGEATKQIIAIRAPELGWSPQAKQTIASWVEELGWTKPPAVAATSIQQPTAETPPAIPVVQVAPEVAAPKAPAAPSIDPEQIQQIVQSLTVLQQTVQQLAAAQGQMAGQITSLQASDSEILERVPAPPLPPAAPARKPLPAQSLRAPALGH